MRFLRKFFEKDTGFDATEKGHVGQALVVSHDSDSRQGRTRTNLRIGRLKLAIAKAEATRKTDNDRYHNLKAELTKREFLKQMDEAGS